MVPLGLFDFALLFVGLCARACGIGCRDVASPFYSNVSNVYNREGLPEYTRMEHPDCRSRTVRENQGVRSVHPFLQVRASA